MGALNKTSSTCWTTLFASLGSMLPEIDTSFSKESNIQKNKKAIYRKIKKQDYRIKFLLSIKYSSQLNRINLQNNTQ
jgi:hypothetical protein